MVSLIIYRRWIRDLASRCKQCNYEMTATHSTAFPTLQQPITSIEKTCIAFGRLHYISYIRNHILYCRCYIWFETYFPTVKKTVNSLCSYCHVTRVGYVPSLSPKNSLLWPQEIKCLSRCYKSGTFCLLFFFWILRIQIHSFFMVQSFTFYIVWK